MGDMAAADKILAEVDKFLRTWRRDRHKMKERKWSLSADADNGAETGGTNDKVKGLKKIEH